LSEVDATLEEIVRVGCGNTPRRILGPFDRVSLTIFWKDTALCSSSKSELLAYFSRSFSVSIVRFVRICRLFPVVWNVMLATN
jgi:hypothetical protein